MRAKKEDSAEVRDMFATLRNVIFIIAIYLYFIGWTYAFYLFNHFGISLNSVDIPFYYFFVYSYSVFRDIFVITMVVATLIVIFFLNSFAPIPLKKWALTLVLIVLFFTFFWLAKERADKNALYIRMGYAKTVVFVFRKDTTKLYPKEFIDANDKRKLKILTQTNDRFYVIYQPQGEGKAIPYGFTYDIPRADILLAKIEMQSTTKKGVKNE